MGGPLGSFFVRRFPIRAVLVTALTATALNSLVIVAHYYAVSANGSDILLWYTVPLMLPLLIALVAIVISLPFFLIRSKRKEAISLFSVAGVYLAFGILCLSIGSKVRMRGFERLADRSRLLIAAVHRFHAENKRPPDSLAELVPNYLATIPNTGMAAYPKYEYVTGRHAFENYDGNPWAVWVDTPSGGINWDIFLYYPRQNYPQRGHGGYLERVKDWAYVHE
jgi:ABC-type transport system involved in multi-copper enzyme maturation permease subunit